MALTDEMVLDGAISVGVGMALVVDGGKALDGAAMAATGMTVVEGGA